MATSKKPIKTGGAGRQALARQADAPAGEILLYQTEDGRTRVECRFADESLWLSQALIAELFQVTVPTVNEHLKNLYREGELEPGSTLRKFRVVRREGKHEVARQIEHYNLDVILAVDRVRSARGTQFRRWATERLREVLVKGFTLDDERLKRPPAPGLGLGLDVNYLADDEIGELNRIVVMWLDFAEDQARRRKQVFLNDWRTKLDEFLRFNERRVLGDAGRVRRWEAVARAEAEYERFAARRRALLEAEGKRDAVAALEAAAKRMEPAAERADRDPPA